MCSWWLQLQSEKSWVRWVDEAFSKLDINGDGFISMEEILDKLPLETTDPDDDMESERFLQVSDLTLQAHRFPQQVLSFWHYSTLPQNKALRVAVTGSGPWKGHSLSMIQLAEMLSSICFL